MDILYRNPPTTDSLSTDDIYFATSVRHQLLKDITKDEKLDYDSLYPMQSSQDADSFFLLASMFVTRWDFGEWANAETKLLQKRLMNLVKIHGVGSVLQRLSVKVPRIPRELYDEIGEEDLAWSISRAQRKNMFADNGIIYGVKLDDFYSVPFEMSPALLNYRTNIVVRGNVILHMSQIPILVLDMFRKHLQDLRDRYVANEHLIPIDDIQDYIVPTPEGSLRSQRIHRTDASILLESALVSEANPPCMRSVISTLQRDHHLHFNPRTYLALYLKNIGVDVFEVLELFHQNYLRASLANKGGNRLWLRKYNPQLSYLLGTQNSSVRKDYSMHSCQKIRDTTGSSICPYPSSSTCSVAARHQIYNPAMYFHHFTKKEKKQIEVKEDAVVPLVVVEKKTQSPVIAPTDPIAFMNSFLNRKYKQ